MIKLKCEICGVNYETPADLKNGIMYFLNGV
jgi:hypothetical protein